MKIQLPEDTITAMAHRAYNEYAKQHRNQGMRFPAWSNITIAARANWMAIISAALGKHGNIININRMNETPHTIILTGLTEDGSKILFEGLSAKMGQTNTESIPASHGPIMTETGEIPNE